MTKGSVEKQMTPPPRSPLRAQRWQRLLNANRPPLASEPPHGRPNNGSAALYPMSLIGAAGLGVTLLGDLPTSGRLALFAFLVAAILWSTTTLSADYIAVGSLLLLVLSGGVPQEVLFQSLASDVVWLMIGAFVLGGAVQKTGLATRLTQVVVSRARTVGGVFWLLTTVLIPLSFLIPSTSGRAAVTLPMFQSLTEAAGDRRVTRALSLLIPTVILVSTIAALVGAGSHLIANDLLRQMTQTQISFGQWALYGLPFGIAASYLACWVVMRLFLLPHQGRQRLTLVTGDRPPLSIAERKTLAIVGGMILLWLTEPWHGWTIATVTILGAMLLTLPTFGVLKWKEGVKSVSWTLVLFVGAALGLGRSLIDTGAAQWLIDHIFALSGIVSLESRPMILVVLALICLTSHWYMTSHSARAAVLVPALLYLASSLQLNPIAVMFIGTVGMDYCLTFPVSSKALLMFQDDTGDRYHPQDLLRLSSVLLPAHLLLMVIFYFGYWQWIGLAL